MTSPLEGFMSDIRATRVSLVKNPANKRKFLVTKSQGNDSMDEIIQIITDSEGANEKDLVEALKAQGKDSGSVNAALSVYRTLNAFRDSLDESDLASIAKSLDYESEAAQPKAADDDDSKADAEAKKAADAETADTGNAASDAVNAVLEELRAEVRTLKSDKRRAEFAKTVADINVGKSKDELIKMLETIDDAGGDVDTIVETLKSASTIADRSLFNEVGSNGAGQAGDDHYNKIEAAAREIAKNENVSVTKAMGLVQERRPELVKEYYENQ